MGHLPLTTVEGYRRFKAVAYPAKTVSGTADPFRII